MFQMPLKVLWISAWYCDCGFSDSYHRTEACPDPLENREAHDTMLNI